MEKFKKTLVCEQDGNKLFILEDCDLIDGVSISKIKKYFPNFNADINTMLNCYIIEKDNGITMYD